jgi:hypothetical protein
VLRSRAGLSPTLDTAVKGPHDSLPTEILSIAHAADGPERNVEDSWLNFVVVFKHSRVGNTLFGGG